MKIRIYFENMQNKLPACYSLKILMRHAVEATLRYENITRDTEISITFVDDAEIRKLNLLYRSKDKATDVLSFPLEENAECSGDSGTLVLGDIVISLERAKAQAAEYGHSYEREAAFLCVHSMLHLLGYDHEKSEADDMDMRRRQREIMESIGLGVKQ
jgi:probable rRNA maturation factor